MRLVGDIATIDCSSLVPSLPKCLNCDFCDWCDGHDRKSIHHAHHKNHSHHSSDNGAERSCFHKLIDVPQTNGRARRRCANCVRRGTRSLVICTTRQSLDPLIAASVRWDGIPGRAWNQEGPGGISRGQINQQVGFFPVFAESHNCMDDRL